MFVTLMVLVLVLAGYGLPFGFDLKTIPCVAYTRVGIRP